MRKILAALVPAVLVLASCTPHRPKSMLPTTVEVLAPRPDTRQVAIPSSTRCAKEECRLGYADLAEWPDACSLLSQAELKAMFPQAVKFSFSPQEIHYTEGPSGAEIGAVPRARCSIGFAFQGDYVDDAGVTMNYGTIISVDVYRVGSAEQMRKDFDSERTTLATAKPVVRHDLGAPECFQDGGWTCREKHIVFKVGFSYKGLPSWERPTSDVTLKVAGRPPRTVDLAKDPDTLALQQIGSGLVRLIAAKIH
ncbi:hypothetical protein [Actinoallomurus iriomotensis]|uniref:Lipoprotein n=1 Tax=Actinoallomurus iriomotensis TaxID=478107 RepID=A0A9W6RLS8_9ACTN|nr:hypothetical protein [Actinoallomurus iriomotensis]GLY78551.1 hypothetical protein Airi01_068180 [Actinoallomurus iriomotensis]